LPSQSQSWSTSTTPFSTSSSVSSSFHPAPLPTRQMLDFHKEANSGVGMPATPKNLAPLGQSLQQVAMQAPGRDLAPSPDETLVSRDSYADRHWGPQVLLAEPNNVCYGRLFFEQKNFERYGWDLYLLSPFLSAGAFFFDVATLPYHCATEPFRKCECSAGYCLPGDPVPLLLYPPELSLTGALAEAATVVGLAAIFP